VNDDELSDRLRRLVDRAQPVDLDEVTHRRPARSNRTLVAALAGVAVLALVAGAVALLRVDRDDAAPVATDPPPTTLPDTTTSVPVTTTAPTTTLPSGEHPDEFVGITSDGRLVVVDVATGEQVRELARMGDPTAPHDPADGPGPNVIQSVEVVPGDPGQAVYVDCCEPAIGIVYAVGLDGSPTTIEVRDVTGVEGSVAFGADVAYLDGDAHLLAVAEQSGIHLLDPAGPASGDSQRLPWPDDQPGYRLSWVETGAPRLVFEAADGAIGQMVLLDGGQWSTLSPPEGVRWTHPVGLGEQLVVAEQCCGSYEAEYEDAVGRVLDPDTGEVLSSFEYDDVVVDQDVDGEGRLLVTYRDGRVVLLDPTTGEQTELASGYTGASW
jgi:hypothetical protein